MSSSEGRTAVDQLLGAARARIGRRVAAPELLDELQHGALVVDTRSAEQRRRDGELPGAVVVERNVLEWRLDPTSPHRLAGFDRPDRRVVVVCDEGYGSSLAAASLRDLGLVNVTDLEGGFQAWRRHVNPEGPAADEISPDAARLPRRDEGVTRITSRR